VDIWVQDANAFNSTRGVSERLGALHALQGKQLEKVNEAHAGDIVACVKLKDTQTGDTLCDKQAPIVYDPVEYPEAAIAFAIEPKSRQDEEKISVALHKILEEDPALHLQSRRADERVFAVRFRSTARRDSRSRS
jgi:elongation factor G